MKIISYSLFGSRTTEPWLFNFYLRGLVWNVKMNKLIYPGWQTHVEIDVDTFSDYDHIFYGLKQHYGISYNVNIQEPLCKSMLWRLKPVFWADSEVVLCRDADAITTARERNAINAGINNNWDILNITDNPAHNLPIMGGMSGFRSKKFREVFKSWDNLFFRNPDLTRHGSDQKLLMDLFNHEGYTVKSILAKPSEQSELLWTSDLTCRHIGSAGVVEMETIRFFKQHDGNSPFIEIEKKYPHIFYWHL